MSKLKASLVGAFLLFATLAHASATYTIRHDDGGRIQTYGIKYTILADEKTRVVIDGDCMSACTLVLGLVPKEQVCVTKRATLGFHSAAELRQGSPGATKPDYVFSERGTQILWNIYPDHVRKAINKRGWDGLSPHPNLMTFKGRALRKLVTPCGKTK